MYIVLDFILVFVSIIMLWKGADWLVDSAAEIAHSLKVSDLIIGLTVVAFGTSAPEFAVTISAAFTKQTDISIGNVIGSNIFNLGFILGGTAIIRPIVTSKKLFNRDGLFLLIVTALIFILFFGFDGWTPDEPYNDIGNGKYDAAEPYIDKGNSNYDIGEPFEDLNNDGVWTSGEPFTDFGNGTYDNGEKYKDLNGDGAWNDSEPFIDAGNNIYDIGEQFQDLGNNIYDIGEPFEDLNNDGVWTSGEPFTDFGNGIYDQGEPFLDVGNKVYDVGESYTDIGNGVYDQAEPFEDLNKDGVWTQFDTFSNLEGLLLFSLLIGYVSFLFIKKDPPEEVDPKNATSMSYVWFFVGLISIVFGGHWMVTHASNIARFFGISDWVIAVTIVAAGTSAPEFATSIAAALKGRHGIAVGNLIGSDLFNLLGVLGLAGIINASPLSEEIFESVFLLVLMVGLTLLLIRTKWKISRWEGAILVSINLVRWYFDFAG